MKYGNTSPALAPGELSELRLQLKGMARKVVHDMESDGISTMKSWKYDVRQVHKEYYAITLEQRAKMSGIDIFKCKG
ncbi:hypothetical protein BD770DRAFT_404734, partial [Pilaira anomala]